jgi:hypothetical protein
VITNNISPISSFLNRFFISSVFGKASSHSGWGFADYRGPTSGIAATCTDDAVNGGGAPADSAGLFLRGIT